MKILTNEKETSLVVLLSGRLDAKSAGEFDRKVKSELVVAEKNVLLDCAQLEYVSSAGLSSLILLSKGLKSKERSLTLLNVQPMVNDMLHVTGLAGKVFAVQS